DGKGQVRILKTDDLSAAIALANAAPAVLEGFVPFTREISVIAVRGADGAIAYYDCPENTHEKGVLRKSVVPAAVTDAATAEAHRIARTILEALDYVGVLAVEFFHLDAAAPSAPSLIVNEIAPRVHNSGHWTMDACAADQFENHIRAISGWPLGATDRHSDVVMRNLIGADVEGWHALIASDPHLSLHLYGKGEARPGRKMGHVNRLSPKS
ncbi:MAG: ATP-grasp domain-containing protein, partial [Hyphomicrobiaceae bacterium]|nr:ATP-grasp domain-containing protein [Hyphomicrobiaceae bacterium]